MGARPGRRSVGPTPGRTGWDHRQEARRSPRPGSAARLTLPRCPARAATWGALRRLLPQGTWLSPVTQPCPQGPRWPSLLGQFPLQTGWVGAGRRQPPSKTGGLALWGATPTPPVGRRLGQEGRAQASGRLLAGECALAVPPFPWSRTGPQPPASPWTGDLGGWPCRGPPSVRPAPRPGKASSHGPGPSPPPSPFVGPGGLCTAEWGMGLGRWLHSVGPLGGQGPWALVGPCPQHRGRHPAGPGVSRAGAPSDSAHACAPACAHGSGT